MKKLIIIIILIVFGCSNSKILEIRQDTIKFVGKGYLIEYGDTVVTKHFTSILDTIIERKTTTKVKYDTINIKYKFPQNEFAVNISMDKDTIFKEKVVETSWYNELSIFDKIAIIIMVALLLISIINFVKLIKG